MNLKNQLIKLGEQNTSLQGNIKAVLDVLETSPKVAYYEDDLFNTTFEITYKIYASDIEDMLRISGDEHQLRRVLDTYSRELEKWLNKEYPEADIDVSVIHRVSGAGSGVHVFTDHPDYDDRRVLSNIDHTANKILEQIFNKL